MTRFRMLGVGCVCIDIVNWCDRFPEEDTDSRVHQQIWVLGGNSTNTCTILRQLGADSFTLSVVGDDHMGPILLDLLEDAGVGYGGCLVRPDSQTPNSIITLSQEKGTRTILHTDNNIRETTCDEFEAYLAKKSYDWIHFEGYTPNIVEIRKMIDFLHKKFPSSDSRPKISLELELYGPDAETLIPGCDYVFLSKELGKSRGFTNMEDTVKGFCQRFQNSNPDTVFFCAWGELGAAAYSNTGMDDVLIQRAFPPVAVVDTIGAGDTFNAGIIYAIAKGKTVKEALEMGCKIAGYKVGKQGLVNLGLGDIVIQKT